MKDQESLFFITSGPATLANPERIEQLLVELQQHGYLLAAKEERLAVWMAWRFYEDPDWRREDAADRAEKQALVATYRERIFMSGLTEQLREQVEQFKVNQQLHLYIYATTVTRGSPLHGLEFDLDISPDGGYLALNYSNDFWVAKRIERDRVEAFDHFLEIVEALYELFHPIYAYAWNHNGIIPVTINTCLEQRKPSTLYEINLFGPEMVENLGGREYLLKTPAQFVRARSDGGVLIIPEAPWYPGSLPYGWSKVAKYLGVVCPDFAAGDNDDVEELL